MRRDVVSKVCQLYTSTYLLLYGSCSGDHCDRAFLLLPSVIGTRIMKPHEAWSFGCFPFQICKRTRQTYTIALAHVYHHLSPVCFLCVWVYGCVCVSVWVCECKCAKMCLCVCVSIRNAIGRWKRRLVVQIASFSGHGTQGHTYRGSCYRVSVRTTTCTLNALIFGVHRWKRRIILVVIIIIIVSSSDRQLPFPSPTWPNQAFIRQRHIIFQGAIKLPTFWLSFAKCRLYLFLT